MSQGHTEPAIIILRRFARINGKEVDESVYKKLKVNSLLVSVLKIVSIPRFFAGAGSYRRDPFAESDQPVRFRSAEDTASETQHHSLNAPLVRSLHILSTSIDLQHAVTGHFLLPWSSLTVNLLS